MNSRRLSWCCLLICLVSPLVFADAEREALAKVVHELRALEILLSEAEANANPDRRIRVRYDWLRDDLHTIRDGVEAHLSAAREQPRTYAPHRGDYRR